MNTAQRYGFPVMLLAGLFLPSIAFVLPMAATRASNPVMTESTCLQASENSGGGRGTKSRKNYGGKKKKMTIGDLKKELLSNLEYGAKQNGRKKSRRTRKRVEKPKQRYVYASQRKMSQNEDNDNNSDDIDSAYSLPILEAKRMGLVNPANQHCDSLVNNVVPQIMGQIRVGEESDENGMSGAYAFLIDKPAGWSILGEKRKVKTDNKKKTVSKSTSSPTKPSMTKRFEFKNEDGKSEYLEYEESEIMALLSPEERAMIEAEGGDFFSETLPADSDVEGKGNGIDMQRNYELMKEEGLSHSRAQNVKRIKARLTSKNDLVENVSFSSSQRPSVVSWLKDKKTAEGNPIRGGKFWKALAGATHVDDSGLVLLCPKKNADNIIVEYSEFVAVVGNGKFLNTKLKKQTKNLPDDAVQVEMISRVRKGREGDVCQTVRFVASDHLVTCSSIIDHAQMQFEDGIRGDPAANPLDRRAQRRLIHCNSMAVSSLIFDETAEVETDNYPDDIAILSDRLNSHKFQNGSFLGRRSLRNNPLTNAYREINGAADGFPGWTVDRYSDWLFVQHDENERRGSLPSIHDGNTAGVYILPSSLDRGAMGSKDKIRPVLLEGRPAPEVVPILENGVTYHVSLDKDLSTGIFLDQRANRAWLTRNCNENTHVLNCFAHCGAFSVAAATAGASTVSLDLNRKWLDRVEPQLEANGVMFDERHDCIFGDCFEWLEKLGKRGEKFDIVILDPPSSSVGKKKKRWSVNRDMSELVQLASPLVKKGGLMWTTTNSASLAPLKFASLCRKGFENAGVDSKLERLQPMSVDFPSVGPQPVKNLVWRIN